MADYTKTTWADNSSPYASAANLQKIEDGIKDAAQDSKQRGPLSGGGARPAAASGNKNWIWTDDSGRGSWYSDGTKWYRIGSGAVDWAPCQVASTGNVTVANPGTATFDGVTLSNGDRILLWQQTTGSENGIYIFNGSGSAMTRAPDAANSGDFVQGSEVMLIGGGTFQRYVRFIYTSASNPTIGSTSLNFIEPDTFAHMPWLVQVTPWTMDPDLIVGTWVTSVSSSMFGNTFTYNTSQAQNNEIGYDLVLAKGTWTLTAISDRNFDRAIVTVLLDGASVGTFDEYAGAGAQNLKNTVAGITVPATGKHRISFKAATRNASSSGWYITFVMFQLRRTA